MTILHTVAVSEFFDYKILKTKCPVLLLFQFAKYKPIELNFAKTYHLKKTHYKLLLPTEQKI